MPITEIHPPQDHRNWPRPAYDLWALLPGSYSNAVQLTFTRAPTNDNNINHCYGGLSTSFSRVSLCLRIFVYIPRSLENYKQCLAPYLAGLVGLIKPSTIVGGRSETIFKTERYIFDLGNRT